MKLINFVVGSLTFNDTPKVTWMKLRGLRKTQTLSQGQASDQTMKRKLGKPQV